MTNKKDKILWKLNSTSQFSIKPATWAKNSAVPPPSKTKFINDF